MRKFFASYENFFAGLLKYNFEFVKVVKMVRDFDEVIMWVIFGFLFVDVYYEYFGSKNKIGDVRVSLMTV